MEGFLHVWRANAFYMGVDEESNLVKDDMDKTKSLLRDIGHFILVPALLNLNEVSLLMGKNVAEGLNVDYHVAIYFAIEAYLGSSKLMNKLWDRFSMFQRMKYFWIKFLMGQLVYFSWCRKFFNSISYIITMKNYAKVQNQDDTLE